MSKKKNKTNGLAFSNKIMLGIIGAILVVLIVFGLVSLFKNITVNSHYYECTKYELVEKGVDSDGSKDIVDNVLDGYKYYRIYFKGNNTFVHKYMAKGSQKEVTVTGSYEKDKAEYILTYNDFIDEPNDVIYELEGKSLVRYQYVIRYDDDNKVIFHGYIRQTFVYK